MRILNSFLLMAGMAFMLAVAPQASATSVNLVQIGGTATCDSGTGVCTGAVGTIPLNLPSRWTWMVMV